MTPTGGPIGARWDDEYRHGRYEAEPPLPFVQDILKILKTEGDIGDDRGLYVGCGNGRNYLSLIDAGARLHGLDISEEAITRLAGRRPGQPLSLVVGDFRSYRGEAPFGYLIAIQVFQHGNDEDASRYFRKTAEILRPGGFFFLRVNSSATEIHRRHTVLERNPLGGFTIQYDEGPKRGLAVHFYSAAELAERTKDAFEPIMAPRQDVIRRAPPETGTWAQWEAIWRKRR